MKTPAEWTLAVADPLAGSTHYHGPFILDGPPIRVLEAEPVEEQRAELLDTIAAAHRDACEGLIDVERIATTDELLRRYGREVPS